ncbi:Inner membrane protein YiaV precursor [Novipirellula aureliae]|uniref:Inner membrane protein YiaV n=1 Tax=Novipirellula aureliae TaxID=2527966 RepID=A0A5C6E5S9_9BACT|nr:biotin/lipoyl-binding protein [Novipirellula aureliae]TWU44178.1 Inner membrane protein YiaV precursor [Novipirellula aureliae]
MVTIITIGYICLVIIVFKVLRVKVTPTTVATAVLTGVVVLGAVIMGWQFSAPMTSQMTVNRNVIPLLSEQDSKEVITKIHVKSDQLVTKGTILWETDKRPNQYALNQAAAQLAVAEANESELEAAVEVAAATVQKAKANQDYQKATLDTAIEIQKLDPQAVAALKVEVQQEIYLSARAAVDQAIAGLQEAKSALQSAQEGIKSLKAQVAIAELNLQQNDVIAPADGYVMNMQIVEGTVTSTAISSAQGIFVDMSETQVVAVFPQNLLANVEPGNLVEIAFKSRPGQIATGKVIAVLEFSGEGQFVTTPVLPIAADVGSKGMLAAKISLDDKVAAKELALGGAGSTAIYTNTGQAFQIITKIAVRLKAWMNYLPV